MQSAEFELKGKTTVPEAVDKSKKAVVSFEKQVEDIGKKFSTAFKDIALGFIAPMIIVNNIIGLISNAIAKAKQDAKDGLDVLSKGETTFASTEEKRAALYFKTAKERKEEARLVEEGKKETVGDYAKTARGKKAVEDYVANNRGSFGAQYAKVDPKLAAGMDKNFMSYMIDDFIRSDEGKKALALQVKTKEFKAPDGVNSVVGMGNNAVGQAIMDQLDEARKHTVLLEQIASGGSHTPPDFTKPHQNTSPSRSAYLKK